MDTTARLADHIARTLTGPVWYGPALLEVLNGVSAAQAAQRPIADGHSIWELVLHTAVWAEIARARVHGASLHAPSATDDFPHSDAATEEHWNAAIARLESSYRELSRAVKALPEEALAQHVPATEAPHSIGSMLHGTIEHGVYHAGQIALLKRAAVRFPVAMQVENRWRQIVASALDWGQAHAAFDAAIANLPATFRGRRPHGSPHSVWELVDHMRRTQHDLLEFCRSSAYRAPNWPGDYWPPTAAPTSTAAWDECIAEYHHDNAAVSSFTVDAGLDLTTLIPHGTGQTYLRTILVAIDHNSHHVGQIISVRRMLGCWTPEKNAGGDSIDSSP